MIGHGASMRPGLKVKVIPATRGFEPTEGEIIDVAEVGLTVRIVRKDGFRSKVRYFPWTQVAWVQYETDDPLPSDAPLVDVRPTK